MRHIPRLFNIYFVCNLLIISIFLPALALAQSDSVRYRNLVFEGGGVRGIAYVGALRVLAGRGILPRIERVGGTSVGSIAALLLALGYTPDELDSILGSLNIGRFNDGRWLFVGGIGRTARRYGWYRGDRFEQWLRDLIVRKTGNADLTFAGLHRWCVAHPEARDLYVTGTNLTVQKSVVLSHTHTPDMLLHTAVRISMSIPLYFGAVFLDGQNQVVRRPKRGQSYQIFVDGGLTANYPITLFDSAGAANPQTLGLKFERPEQLRPGQPIQEIAPYQIDNLADYVSAFYNYAIKSLNRQPESEAGRTIYISTEGISPRVRRMPAAQRQRLIESGERGARAFFR